MPTSQTYQLRLSWFNSVGGWEYWNFLAKKTHGYNVGKVNTIKKDVFETWDTTFIAGLTESANISIDASKQVIVRSQLLTVQQIEAIARIKISLRVRDVSQDVTVLIDSASFEYRTDGEKLHQIEFVINYPNEQIQSL